MFQMGLSSPFFPLIGALVTLFISRKNERLISNLASFFVFLAFLISILNFFIINNNQSFFVENIRVIYVDNLSKIMTFIVSGISLVVHLYSKRYMQDDEGYKRFYVFLGLITFSILLSVNAGNFIIMIIAFELITLFLYFLMSHNHRRKEAYKYSFHMFFTYRIGDFFLILSAVLAYKLYGTFDIPTILNKSSSQFSFLIPLFIILAAFLKSAQFPFHTWLAYSMEGPTPVSALMHAGIVNAGGFLANRFYPLFTHDSSILHLSFIVGILTALIGSSLMLTQNDIKKSLGYSTMGQMGYMMMEVGVGAFALAIYHLFAHGIFKATLFMGSGSVIHSSRKDPNIPKDEVYRFMVEKKVKVSKLPEIVFILITLIVPFFIIFFFHFLADKEFFKHQGALILLFFGWASGVQLILSTYRISYENPLKLISLTLLSFSIVILGYVFIGDFFEKFLFGDNYSLLYKAASFNPIIFYSIVILLMAAVITAWTFIYRNITDNELEKANRKVSNAYLSFYALLSREFYILDIYRKITSTVESISAGINSVFKGL